eukprot:3643749-Amphidinium_carterae.1
MPAARMRCLQRLGAIGTRWAGVKLIWWCNVHARCTSMGRISPASWWLTLDMLPEQIGTDTDLFPAIARESYSRAESLEPTVRAASCICVGSRRIEQSYPSKIAQ